MHVLYTEKFCNKCTQTKPLDSFKPNRRNVDGRSFVCVDCVNETRKLKNAKRRERYRNDPVYRASIIRKVGISRSKRYANDPEYKARRDAELAKLRESAISNPTKVKALRKKLYRKSSRETHMISRYGIDFPTFRKLKEEQGNRCKLCERPFPEGDFVGKQVAIDHCHVTGVVRGILCIGCNTALGRLGDNEAGLLKALKYVKGEL